MPERYFIPGSEWLFFKIYTGHKSADTILSEHLRPWVASLLKQAYVDSFFFIRYSDPEYHIRLRLHIPNQRIGYGTVMCTVYDMLHPLISEGLISSVMCDTYIRELERYGEYTIEAIEQFFFLDSLYELDLLHLLNEESIIDPEQLRWRMSIRLIDDMCKSFFPELVNRAKLLGKMAESYRKEFNLIRAAFTGQLNDLYRTHRKLIVETLNMTEWMPEKMQSVFAQRKVNLAEQTAIIQELNMQTEEPLEEEHLFWSFIHMTMNRWFRSQNRLHEMVIYNFMSKYYESISARMRYNK